MNICKARKEDESTISKKLNFYWKWIINELDLVASTIRIVEVFKEGETIVELIALTGVFYRKVESEVLLFFYTGDCDTDLRYTLIQSQKGCI